MPQSLHCIVSGRVQGVFFRAWTEKQAKQLGLRGWVRNKPNGTVEVLAQGDKNCLMQLENKLHEGPPASRVDELKSEYQELEETLPNFYVQA